MPSIPLIPSGLQPLDRQIGGLIPARPYLVSGSPGAGKSVSCLEFLDVAVRHGEHAVLLTHDDPADVLSTAAFLGIDAEPALLDGRLVILRFQLDFVRRFGRAPYPDHPFEELRSLLEGNRVSRLAIDSVIPFLEGGGAGSGAVFSLTQFLEAHGATSWLTYPGDLAGLYDRRMEPLMQRAGGFFHLATQPSGRRRGTLEIRKLRFEAPSVAPIQFRIAAGAGFVQEGAPNEPDGATSEEVRHHLLLVNLSTPFPTEVLGALEREYRVTSRDGITAAFSDLVRSGVGAVLLNVRRDVINDALHLVRELRLSDVRTPVVIVTPYHLRSSDRTRALRAGADDFLSLNLPPAEFLARVSALTARGRSTAIPAPADPAVIAQPVRADGTHELFDPDSFSTAVGAILSREKAPYFTLVLARAPEAERPALGDFLLRSGRLDSGDLVGQWDGAMVLLADGARPRDLNGLVDRLTAQWMTQGGASALTFETIGYPEEDDRVLSMLGVRLA